jgi:hypothetical protein
MPPMKLWAEQILTKREESRRTEPFPALLREASSNTFFHIVPVKSSVLVINTYLSILEDTGSYHGLKIQLQANDVLITTS